MKHIFESHNLGGIQLENRLVRSATFESGGAENGVITPLLKKVYEDLAKGQVGLIITGMMGVGPNACAGPAMVKVYDESFVLRFSEIARSVHQFGGKIVVQLSHCGAKATVIDWGEQAFCPSEYKQAKAISTDEIAMLVKSFGQAAAKCKAAGADGVQIHGAHGYLLNQFLSPFFNQRTDEYGGDVQGRSKFLFEVYEEIRSAVGADYPVLLKINYSDLVENGFTGEECAWVCQELERRGLNAVEVSSGLGVSRDSGPVPSGPQVTEGFFAAGGLDIAEKLSIPVFNVGGYRAFETIEAKLNEGRLAAISLCRPFIREPDLAARWRAGDRKNAACISCNKCFGMPQFGCAVKQ